MDIEKAMEFILNAQANAEVHMARIREAQEQSSAKHDAEIAAIREAQEQSSAKHNAEMAAIREQLRRAVRLSVQEARNERSKRRELEARFDEKITQLAAAHLVTEEVVQNLGRKIDRFLDGINRGNGTH